MNKLERSRKDKFAGRQKQQERRKRQLCATEGRGGQAGRRVGKLGAEMKILIECISLSRAAAELLVLSVRPSVLCLC